MIAIVAFVVCAAFVVAADPWDPLLSGISGPGFVLALALAVGLVAGRLRVLLVVLALVPLSLLNRAPEPFVFYVVAVPVLVAACASLIAAGVGLRALARRRSAAADRRLRAGGVAIACAATALTAWGVYLDHRVVDREPSAA